MNETMPVCKRAGDGGIKRLDLERAIARLPEGARAAFLLHDVEGFQHQEIAGFSASARAPRNPRSTKPGFACGRF